MAKAKKKVGKKSAECPPKGEGILMFLHHIHAHPGQFNTEQLGELCHISERGVYRYLNTLSKVGIAVTSVNGGYTLLDTSWKQFMDEYHPGKLSSIKQLVEIGMYHCNDEDLWKFGKAFLHSLTSGHRKFYPGEEDVDA